MVKRGDGMGTTAGSGDNWARQRSGDNECAAALRAELMNYNASETSAE